MNRNIILLRGPQKLAEIARLQIGVHHHFANLFFHGWILVSQEELLEVLAALELAITHLEGGARH